MSNIKFIEFKFINYEMAKAITSNKENRKINHGHLKKIRQQILSSSELIPPITINVVTNHIIDGQHRLLGFISLIEDGLLDKNSLLKTMYVSIPEEEEKARIVDANTNSKNWQLEDYINSYVKAGIDSYVGLNNWCLNHILTSEDGKPKYRYGAAILKQKPCLTELKDGSFNYTEQEIVEAEDIHTEMLEIIELFNLKLKGNWIEALAASWCGVRKQHPFRTWMRELKYKKATLMKQPKTNKKEWDSIFATVHMAIDKKNAK